ncbi:hypothetical protein FB567DRAFT_98767 [Paraphoma chrysanthemicola]|uniref:Secreted protein n=1 Tax=Paraphoma chrysanthemicola TaxID=798071 RepID=A0A8K0VWT2_9PLEO|nr:hypothetical protein FB567DRAFT_98767 [Paraphoma chrysanthemicola]
MRRVSSALLLVLRATCGLPIKFLPPGLHGRLWAPGSAAMVHGRQSVITDDMLLPFPPDRLIGRLFSCHLRACITQVGVRTTLPAMKRSQSSFAQHSPNHACATRSPWPTVSLDPTRPA